jgi:hypothetical protein
MIKKYFIIAAAIAITGCKSVPKQDTTHYEITPDKVEYVVSLGGENWSHNLITVDALSEALDYYERYKESHGDMIITEIKYFGQRNVVSVVD